MASILSNTARSGAATAAALLGLASRTASSTSSSAIASSSRSWLSSGSVRSLSTSRAPSQDNRPAKPSSSGSNDPLKQISDSLQQASDHLANHQASRSSNVGGAAGASPPRMNGSQTAFANILGGLSAAPPSSSRSSQSQKMTPEEQAEHNFANRAITGYVIPRDPTTHGRMVRVMDSNVAAAYRGLSSILRRNDVRKELRLGERYEKPNQERRRKRSERHRRRFRDMVRKKVQLVMAIRARGA